MAVSYLFKSNFSINSVIPTNNFAGYYAGAIYSIDCLNAAFINNSSL